MNRKPENFAVVTGASQGLGRALAEELAGRGHNLLLAALPGTGLPELSVSLEVQHNVVVKYMEIDLMRQEAPREILEFAVKNGIAIDILVNNVGIGHGGGIGEYSEAAIEESVFLNIRCTTLMTNIFAGELDRGGKAYILNIGSFGGFLPVPYKSIYSATKSYIYHFTLAVREEFRGNGVSVSVAMPGGIITNQKVRERLKEVGPVARVFSMEPERAARIILNRMFRGKGVIIPGFSMRAAYFAGSVMPYWLLKQLLGKMFKGVN
ncbi:MAG: SDR family NAD(P)-dependent oxidoreductase [Bacteroidales bacterium]|nr:SDR family NAD(P)-dependent oxidoreductase [Bacteroidales bacterium]